MGKYPSAERKEQRFGSDSRYDIAVDRDALQRLYIRKRHCASAISMTACRVERWRVDALLGSVKPFYGRGHIFDILDVSLRPSAKEAGLAAGIAGESSPG
jgi:hypothetical protein